MTIPPSVAGAAPISEEQRRLDRRGCDLGAGGGGYLEEGVENAFVIVSCLSLDVEEALIDFARALCAT